MPGRDGAVTNFRRDIGPIQHPRLQAKRMPADGKQSARDPMALLPGRAAPVTGRTHPSSRLFRSATWSGSRPFAGSRSRCRSAGCASSCRTGSAAPGRSGRPAAGGLAVLAGRAVRRPAGAARAAADRGWFSAGHARRRRSSTGVLAYRGNRPVPERARRPWVRLNRGDGCWQRQGLGAVRACYSRPNSRAWPTMPCRSGAVSRRYSVRTWPAPCLSTGPAWRPSVW
jgi:hypothetical protein